MERNRLRQWRQARGWSLREVAALTGFTAAMLSLVERHERDLSPASKICVARALGVPLEVLFAPPPRDGRHRA
jgi:transcriptional regulator with XRE-family HTH domain